MGYGEFGGTGSVNWKVVHSDKDDVKKKEEKANQKDSARPKGSGGEFIVVVNGLEVARVQIDDNNDHQIRVIWTPDTLATVP